MNSLGRIGAIVRADFLLRFRRTSTVIVFLLLSAFAYVWIPSPATGRTLIQINGHRAIYNSGALGMATASIGMIFVGLFGYYVISNAVRRDIVTRCGLVAASTPMRSSEYLLGKFCGNLAFLFTFMSGFMLSSMAMQLVRGEAPLEPLVFVRQYLLLTPAAMILVSAVAVFFESTTWLSGKLGDVAYFFLFISLIGLVAGNEVSGGRINWARSLDFTGFGFMIHQMQQTLHTDSVSIGSSPFDPALVPIVFPGLSMTPDWIVPRLISLVLPLGLLPLAALVFHRFDPVRTGRSSGRAQRKWIGKLQSLAKPLSRRVVALLAIPARNHSLGAAIWLDGVLTFTLSPLTLFAFLGVSVAAIFARADGLLPIVFALLAIVIADVATRDVRAGTTASLYAISRLRENFVWWKFGSTCVCSFLFCAVPLLASALHGGGRFLALCIGILFVGASATALGVLTANAKTFIVAFLSFWYLVVNDKGATPMLDFAGFYGSATARTIALYGAMALGAVTLAHVVHRARLARA
ncbi:MAG: hypothetical protein M3Y86_10700 [Verrucomicrobiota bacterium]|nr:hypothetical protein [Verrucomicrobiota bacterium]